MSAAPVVEAIAALLREKIAGGCEGAAALRQVLEGVAAAQAVEPPPPRSLPATRYLEQGLALAAESGPSDLVEALEAATPSFHWRQNPNYLDKLDETYLAGYGFIDFVGELAPLRVAEMRLGLLLIGPERHYPKHNHPAEEIYVPLTTALWWRAGEDWRAVPPGEVIHHAPWREHATKTRDVPLIALYAWLGDIGRNAELTAA